MRRWYVHRGERPAQLVEEAQLIRELRVADPLTIYVCVEGGSGWLPANGIPELRAALAAAEPPAQSPYGAVAPRQPGERSTSLPALGPYLLIPGLLAIDGVAFLLAQWGASTLALVLMALAALGGMAVAGLLVLGAALGVRALTTPLELLSGVRAPFSSTSVRTRTGPVVQDRLIRRVWVCMVGALYLLPSLYPAYSFAMLLPAMLHPAPLPAPPLAPSTTAAPMGAERVVVPLRVAEVDGYVIERVLRAEGLETERVGSPLAPTLRVDARSADGSRTVEVTRLDLGREGQTYELGERRAVHVDLIGAEAPELAAALLEADSLSWDGAAALIRRAGFRVDVHARPEGADVAPASYERLGLHGQHGRDGSVFVTIHEWSGAGAVEREPPVHVLVVRASGDPTGAESRRLLDLILERSPEAR